MEWEERANRPWKQSRQTKHSAEVRWFSCGNTWFGASTDIVSVSVEACRTDGPSTDVVGVSAFKVCPLRPSTTHTTGVNDTGGKFCHQFPLCCWHRWQIIGTISGCRNQKVNLKSKLYIYVSSTTQRWPNKMIKIFQIEDFFHLPPVSLTPVANLELRISPRIFEKIRNGLTGILWGWGETDSWKEPEAKKLVTLSL